MVPRIELMTLADLADVRAEHAQFWGDRDLGFLHQRVFVQEFGATCLVARGAGGRIDGYLLGFTTPREIGYIHAVAVRDTARGNGCGQALYLSFADAAAQQGAGSGGSGGSGGRFGAYEPDPLLAISADEAAVAFDFLDVGELLAERFPYFLGRIRCCPEDFR
jgi:GNAT superfamily N-acetyltransferase